jgi:hypothetical protein
MMTSLMSVMPEQAFAQTTATAATTTWVIAAAPFSITGRQRVTTKAETLLPTYILDQLSGDHNHQVSQEEHIKRKLALLQTQQQALFLELSAAIRKRDAAVLESPRTSTVRKTIAAEEKKIKETKAKLDTNTHEIRLLQPGYVSDIAVPLTFKTRRVLAKQRKAADTGESIEKVTLWKDNSDTLYTAYRGSDGKPVDGALLEKALTTEKINALITGSISVQDEYAAVTVELRRYPGGQLLATAMEIGQITNVGDLAQVLAFDLMPGVESMRPATLIFNLDENMPKNFTVSVDSNIFSDTAIPDRYPVAAGVHQVSFEAEGYKTESLSMDFAADTTYRVGVRMEQETLNAISLNLRTESKGFFLINGVTHDSPSEEVKVGNNALLGRFDPETEEDASAIPGYFVVPAAAATSSSRDWTVNPFQQDVSANIEKARKSLYFSYTLLMMSVPVLFMTMGESYNYSRAPDSANTWTQIMGSNITYYSAIGVTATLGVNFIWRLIRYMRSANPVIPVVAAPLNGGGK